MAAAFAAFLLIFGCIGQTQPVGASNIADVGWYSGRLNTTGVYANLSLGSAFSRHVFAIWTTNGSTFTNTTTFSLIGTKTCAVTPYGGGLPNATRSAYNDTTLAKANGTRSIAGIVNPERNTTSDNMTVAYQNVSGETVTVYLNGYYLGTLNTSTNSKTFSVTAGYLANATNTVQFINNVTVANSSLGSTNVTNVTVNYVNSTAFTCSNSNAVDGSFATVFETESILNMFNITFVNSTLNNTSTFDINIYGGDIGVVTNTNSTYVGAYHRAIGGCDPLGYSYPLAWNTTSWTNATGLSSSVYAYNGQVIVCLMRRQTGNVTNYGAVVDYAGLSGTNNYTFSGGVLANVTFQTSIDNTNWFTESTSTSVGSTAVRVQTNNTGLYARFNVTGLTVTDPSQDGVYIRYVGVSN
jgi:hypothetical protein